MIEAVFKYIYNYKKQIKDYIFVQLLVLLWICAYLKNGVYIEQFHILFVSRSIIFFFGILAIVVLVGYLLLLHKSRIRIREDMGEFIHLGMLPLSLILVFFSCGQNNVIVVILTMFLAVYAIILGLANIKKMTPIRKKKNPVPPKMSPNILKASSLPDCVRKRIPIIKKTEPSPANIHPIIMIALIPVFIFGFIFSYFLSMFSTSFLI